MKRIILALALLVAPLTTKANYAAYAISSSSYSLGAYGFAWNYGTSSAAVNAAISYMPGYSPYSYRYWNNLGYTAFARGYSSNYRYYQYGYSWGYGSSSAAANAALSYVSPSYRYSLSYRYGFNY